MKNRSILLLSGLIIGLAFSVLLVRVALLERENAQQQEQIVLLQRENARQCEQIASMRDIAEDLSHQLRNQNEQSVEMQKPVTQAREALDPLQIYAHSESLDRPLVVWIGPRDCEAHRQYCAEKLRRQLR